MTPTRWQALEQILALLFVTTGVALIHPPSAFIVFGLGLYTPTIFRRM